MDAFSATFGTAFKAAAKSSGMTVVATITSAGVTADFDIGFKSPDIFRFDGKVQSHEYEIEMLSPDDCPTLTEGDGVVIGGMSFRVRQVPFNDDPGADGYFRKALLTKV